MIHIITNKKNFNLTTFLNPFSYLLSRDNKKQLRSFNIEIDGGMLVVLLSFFGIRTKRRSFDMTSLAPLVFNDAIKKKRSLYFIGTKPKIIDLAIKNIQEQFPKLEICGFRDGYLSNEERELELQKIKNLDPYYVICGMGTPMQEQFLIDLQKTGWEGQGYTCGGFLHQTANGIQYYPEYISRFGLRAFYRMYDEPKLVKRYFIIYPQAVCLIIFDLIKYKMGISR